MGIEGVSPCASGLEPLWTSPGIVVWEGVCCSVTVLVVPVLASPARVGTSQSCEEASSERALSACSVPPGCAFITAAVLKEGLNWCLNWRSAVTVGDTMVGVFSFTAFTHDELLAKHLVGCVVLTSCFDSFLISVLVIKSWAGIFECMSTTEVQ